MASHIGPGNYFSGINAEIATRGPSKEALQSAQAATGSHETQKKSALGKKGAPTIELKDGVTLSQPSQDVFKTGHQQQVEEHGLEFAHLTGATQHLEDDEAEVESRRERNHDRNVGLEEQPSTLRQVVSPRGVVQQLEDEDHMRLQEMDSSLHSALHLNSDVPPEKLEAARRMLNTEPGKVDKNANIKHGPEAEEAIKPELRPVPMLVSPMEICEPKPAKDLLESEHDLETAKRYAADRLASGQGDVVEQLFSGN